MPPGLQCECDQFDPKAPCRRGSTRDNCISHIADGEDAVGDHHRHGKVDGNRPSPIAKAVIHHCIPKSGYVGCVCSRRYLVYQSCDVIIFVVRIFHDWYVRYPGDCKSEGRCQILGPAIPGVVVLTFQYCLRHL